MNGKDGNVPRRGDETVDGGVVLRQIACIVAGCDTETFQRRRTCLQEPCYQVESPRQSLRIAVDGESFARRNIHLAVAVSLGYYRPGNVFYISGLRISA